ncbi:MAG: hypothetical protein Q9161_006600 [Pseudevernia consocians]
MDMMRSMQSKLEFMIAKAEAFLPEEAKRAIQSITQSTSQEITQENTQEATQEATQESTILPTMMSMIPLSMEETPVKPSSAMIKAEVINLPPPDQFMIRAHMIFLLCFRLDPEVNPRQVYSELRCGLSDALVEFPFFVGRVVRHDVARDLIQINMSPNDGVPFKYKYHDLTSFPDFRDLEQEHFPPSKLKGLALSPVDQVFASGDDEPALLLQANFIKGGLLLGISFHHSTSDIAGWTAFLKSLAKHTAAASKGSRTTPHPSHEILDRGPLFHVNKDATYEQCETLVKVDDVPERINQLKTHTSGPLQQTMSGNIVCALWYFSSERLQALKAASQSANKADPWVSTNDALSALFWRHVTMARQLEKSAYATSTFQLSCNIRGRCSPKLHPEYVGNAVANAHCSCPIQELCSTAPNGLYLTASAIRKAVDRVNDSAVRNFYGLVDSLPTISSAEYNRKLAPGPDFFMSSTGAFDWNGFDWGNHMGREVKHRFLRPMNYVTPVAVLPRLRDGGLEVMMGHERDVIERLKLDETFMTFAEFRCH